MALHSYSLRTKIFIGFMVVCFFSIIGSTAMSYLIIKKSTDEQSVTEMQSKFEALMKTLDYAVSHTNITQEKDLVNRDRRVLPNGRDGKQMQWPEAKSPQRNSDTYMK